MYYLYIHIGIASNNPDTTIAVVGMKKKKSVHRIVLDVGNLGRKSGRYIDI